MKGNTCPPNCANCEREELEEPYYRRDHSHCWEDGDNTPPCGQKIEDHKQCCLCDLKVPNETIHQQSEAEDKE